MTYIDCIGTVKQNFKKISHVGNARYFVGEWYNRAYY